MRGRLSEGKGMGLRGTDTSLRPPPPLHFLFHFLSSLNAPSLPLSLLSVLPLRLPGGQQQTHMHTPVVRPGQFSSANSKG